MPEQLNPDSLKPPDPDEQQSLRALNRSPHPYHHLSPELPYASDRFRVDDTSIRSRKESCQNGDAKRDPPTPDLFSKDSSPGSDSGTEADDEHFLKGLPAPKAKLHKGVRGRNEHLSGSTTPIPSPAIWEEEASDYVRKPATPTQKHTAGRKHAADLSKRNKNLAQRATEVVLIVALGLMVRSNREVAPLVKVWDKGKRSLPASADHFAERSQKTDYQLAGLLYIGLLALYPLRVVFWAYRKRNPSKTVPLQIPVNFDPAPIMYPPAITTFVSLLIATDNQAVILPNIILSISSWPQPIIPKFELQAVYDSLHWLISCLPLVWTSSQHNASMVASTHAFVSNEDMTLLYPLHRTLCIVLHHLTTTSLLPAELQLFSIALINILILASSPQVMVLKSLLWVGGLGLLILCGPAIKSGIILARVPRWRFRQLPGHRRRPLWKELSKIFSWRRIKSEFFSSQEDLMHDSSSEDSLDSNTFKGPKRVRTLGPNLGKLADAGVSSDVRDFQPTGLSRSHTLSYVGTKPQIGQSYTASGRRKRAVSVSVRPFLKLTYTQSIIRKWLYALFVYAMLAVVILAGIRTHMQLAAFNGQDPIGWALGYLFGDLPWFRFQVVKANLESWICLPSRTEEYMEKQCHMGWVQQLRHNDFGEANTRLLIGAYWAMVFFIGMITVLQLKEIYEVDTRRKVFHFMMVGMLLPATFVDPGLPALSLAIALGIFLILDLLRASQLPPLSKPIASFLAPYVDGRDFRGPVVISHIFLLIGCAIPLWLSLAALPRAGTGYAAGWELPAREVSMVSGVICVGLGDAAASLIGRRYGHRKWLWGGGKSLEGSVAFAAAVFVGLAAASLWLRIGGWPVAGEQGGLLRSAKNAAACASIASLNEAVLTGGNDNVIVPVFLWTCVKSLAI